MSFHVHILFWVFCEQPYLSCSPILFFNIVVMSSYFGFVALGLATSYILLRLVCRPCLEPFLPLIAILALTALAVVFAWL